MKNRVQKSVLTASPCENGDGGEETSDNPELLERMAHDIRNQMNVAHGSLELARETGDDEHFERVERALSRIEQITGSVLEEAGGEPEFNTESVAVAEAAQDASNILQPTAATLELDTETVVDANPPRLRTLFENLFQNAVQHNAQQRIQIYVTDLEHEDGFVVEDTGTGFEISNPDVLFKAGVTTGRLGDGLGLAIVENIVTAHNWTITATTSETGGARFEIRTTSADEQQS